MVYTQCVCRWLCRCVTGGLPACTPQQRGRPGYRPQWIRVACWESWQRHCHEAELRTVGESCNDDSMGRVRFWLGSRSPSFERPVGELAIAWRVPALPQSLPVFPLHALPQVTTWRFVPAAHTDRSQYIDGSPRMVLVARGCPPPLIATCVPQLLRPIGVAMQHAPPDNVSVQTRRVECGPLTGCGAFSVCPEIVRDPSIGGASPMERKGVGAGERGVETSGAPLKQ